MKHSKKLFSAALAMCMTMGTAASFPISANAAAYNWDMRPAWTPHDFMSAMDFVNTYGATHVQDDMICIVKRVLDGQELSIDVEALLDSSASAIADAEYELKRFTFNFKFPEEPDESDTKAHAEYEEMMNRFEFMGLTDENALGYHYEAVMIGENSNRNYDVKVGFIEKDSSAAPNNFYTYSFRNDVETDILGWYPDSVPEYNKFIEDNGNISYRDGCLIFAHDINYSTGAELRVDQSGEGKLKVKKGSVIGYDELFERAGSTSHLIRIYEGEKAGDVDISFDVNIPWSPEEYKKPVLTANTTVNDALKVSERNAGLPGWIPQSFEAAVDFVDKHGCTFVKDGFICCVRSYPSSPYNRYSISYSGSASENIDDYIKYSEKFRIAGSSSSNFFEVVALNIPENSDITINYDYEYSAATNHKIKSFSFSKDSTGYITQNDIYAWLPDCDEEFNDYYKKHGAFSIQDGYVMYCTNIASGSGYLPYWSQSGTGGLSEYYSDTFIKTADAELDGGTRHYIKLFKPIKSGTVKLDIDKSRDYYSSSSKTDSSQIETAYFKIDDEMRITPAEEKDMKTTVKGDCNSDGILGISDAVALKNWLHGKGGSGSFDMADFNGDGTVDVFDLIALKKNIIKSFSEEPRPVYVEITENYAWHAYQYVDVYDQYGNAYSYCYNPVNNDREERLNSTLRMNEDNWYEMIEDIMEKASENLYVEGEQRKDEPVYYQKTGFKLNERPLEVINAFAKKTAKYADKDLYSVGAACDMGETTIYTIDKNAEGTPVFAKIAQYGDSAGWIDEPETKEFVKTLISYNIFTPQLITVLEGMRS